MSAPASLEHPQAIRAVFFDVGFTLLAPHPSVVDIVLDVCARRRTPVARKELARELPHAEGYLRRTTHADPWTWGDEAAITAIWQGYFTTLLRPCLHGASEEEVAACAHAVQLVF